MAVERLTGGLTPADGSDPRTFPAIWNATADDIEQSQADIAGLQQGFRFVGTRYFFSDGQFEKADPFDDGNHTGLVLRAIRVRLVAGGGGTSYISSSAGNGAASSGGSSGGYAERFFTDIAAMPSSVDVTVGAGGAGGTVSFVSGQGGGTSEFGGSGDSWRTRAEGGGASNRANNRGEGDSLATRSPTAGIGLDGDLLIQSSAAGPSVGEANTFFSVGGAGADSMFGGGGRGAGGLSANSASAGDLGGFGAGAGGGVIRGDAGPIDGSPGTTGLVVIDCFV